MSESEKLDLTVFRARLEGARGRQYWRSLEELAEEEGFEEFLHREFPSHVSAWQSSVDRRDFLKLMGASIALAGLTGCDRPPPEKIVPYVHAPEHLVPGKPLYFATAMTLGGSATGLLVESHMGRPTKIEGNPGHPSSLGATDAFCQASILGLYDPDRAQTVRERGRITTWTDFLAAFSELSRVREGRGGAGVALLTQTVVSPTLGDQIRRAMQVLPGMKWHQYEASSTANRRRALSTALGSQQDVIYDLSAADVVLTIDADLLASGPGHLRYAREFASRRKVRAGSKQMSRLYAIESTPTPTGAIADHRLPVRPSSMLATVEALAVALGVAPASPDSAGVQTSWVAAVARDLQSHRGRVLIAAGDHLAPEIHLLVHRMNEALGALDRTLRYREPVEVQPVDSMASIRDLVADLRAGRVEVLVILGGNPVYDAPADLAFGDALDRVPFRVHMSQYYNETSATCYWHIPENHYLESWSDTRSFDGTYAIVQPLIEPLYNSRSPHELLGVLAGELEASPYELVRSFWGARVGGADFERWWQRALHDGVIAESSVPASEPFPVSQGSDAPSASTEPAEGSLDIVFRNDPTVHDGRFANNAWLQELPKPLTKLTWDNAALIAPSTARRLGLRNEDRVELRYRGRSVAAPVWILPGQPPDTVTVHLGYGRTRAGRVAEGTGFDANRIRTSDSPWFGTGVEIRKLGGSYRLATTQQHHSMEGRDLVRQADFATFLRNPHQIADSHLQGVQGGEPHKTPSLYPGWTYPGAAWGMVIDTTICTGCHGCVVACQAENNIPTVGKKEVLRQREMHWLRIDRYYEGAIDNPATYHQPVPCMHCENAPCEPVCPVEATSHSEEGLNDMTYNRCIGTRYCSNNCPYKVRRFNFFQYADFETESLKLMRNPDVTVRQRGVMEKCTYCVQRINAARIEAEKEGRKVRDGEIRTACQQACPTEAIVFGDINDPEARVTALKNEPHHFGLLALLNTRPRTTYLAAIRNPNPELETT